MDGPCGGARRLEELDEVAVGVGEQDLLPAGAADHVAVQRYAGGVESVDLAGEVVDEQVDAVAAGPVGIDRGSTSAGTAGAGQQDAERSAGDVCERWRWVAAHRKAEVGGVEVDGHPHV